MSSVRIVLCTPSHKTSRLYIRRLPHRTGAKLRAGALRGSGPERFSLLFGAATAGQRLYPLYLFACLLVEYGVAEVDPAIHAGVRVVL